MAKMNALKSIKDVLRPRRIIDNISNLFTFKKVKKTTAEKQKDYRERIKSDPDKYKLHRQSETKRVKQYRDNCSEEQKANNREKARDRARRSRERKKSAGESESKPKKKMTRSERKKQTDSWREQKRKQRKNMNPQKKRRLNEKRRAKYAEKKVNEAAQSNVTNSQINPSTSSASDVGSGFKTNDAQRKAASRAMQSLPKSPEKFAQCMEHIIKTTTPRRKGALSSRCILSPSKRRKLEFLEDISIRKVLHTIKKRRNTRDINVRRIIHQAVNFKKKIKKQIARKYLGLSWKFLSKPQSQILPDRRTKRKDAIPVIVVNSVIAFYNRGDISREMPNPRMASRRVLECSLRMAFREFKAENPDVVLSFSKFTKLRPKNVLPMCNTRLMQCLCEYCINVEFKLKAINYRISREEHLKHLVISNKFDLSMMTLCSQEGVADHSHYRRACIERSCDTCGIDQIRRHYQPLVNAFENEEIRWKCWMSESYTKTKKDGTVNEEAKHMVLKVLSGSIAKFVEEFCTSLHPFSSHLLNAKWQVNQFDVLKKSLPENWVLMCMDFGENYNCHFQDEAQSAHWSYQQATIHPIVAYYECPVCKVPMHESVIILSDDRKHDHHAVQHFVKITNDHLLKQGIQITREIHFSDGSPCQYKSKTNFADASFGNEDFGFPVEKHFFGSRHGKGPCDGEIGVLKKHAKYAVRSRQVIISNALDLFNYGKAKLSLPMAGGDTTENHIHKKRTFLFVKEGEIQRDRKDRTDVKCVQKTRSIHCVRGISPYNVNIKDRSCFCGICTDTHRQPGQNCPNLSITGQWNSASISKTLKKRVKTVNKAPHVVTLEEDSCGEPTTATSCYQYEETADIILKDVTIGNGILRDEAIGDNINSYHYEETADIILKDVTIGDGILRDEAIEDNINSYHYEETADTILKDVTIGNGILRDEAIGDNINSYHYEETADTILKDVTIGDGILRDEAIGDNINRLKMYRVTRSG